MNKIVLMDDELGSQMQIYLALCEQYNIEIAENVESVMYLLRKTRPHILMLDYGLGHFRANGKTGLDFLRKIKRKYSELKVVMILDASDKTVEAEIHQSGADGILFRPIRNRHLLTNVKRLSPNAQATA